MERSNKLEDAVEKAGARQLAALVAVGMGGGGGERPLAIVGQGTSERVLGPGAGVLEALTGSAPADKPAVYAAGAAGGVGGLGGVPVCNTCGDECYTKCPDCKMPRHPACTCAFCTCKQTDAAKRAGAGEAAAGGAEQGECATCGNQTVTRCPACGAWCHENCRQESGCGFCHQGMDAARSQLLKFGGRPPRRPRRLTSMVGGVEVVGRDGKKVDFRVAGLVAFFAGFVCALVVVAAAEGLL
ncbi:MAG TPA: hypothetical protein VHM90_07080 [Phycisphaerae bacterium]|nr:hypothetical protein [Phycisphaerae bacterium]